MHEASAKSPILFWGWNFQDYDLLAAINEREKSVTQNQRRWALLYPNPSLDSDLEYLQAMGYNVIIGSTDDMLEYLVKYSETLGNLSKPLLNETIPPSCFSRFIPPAEEQVTRYNFEKYFTEYNPHWYFIYSHQIPKTHYYKELSNAIAEKKNIIVTGIRGAGKTTLLRQLLIDEPSPIQKHYVEAPTLEKAKMYLNLLNGDQSLLFIDDCFRDTDAIIYLMQSKNIQTICFDRDFNYEHQIFKINRANISYVFFDITEITELDAQAIMNVIPPKLVYSESIEEPLRSDPTIINLLTTNLKSQNFSFIKQFEKKDHEAALVFLMICYVHACGVPCSFDMIYSFLGDENYNWEQMMNIVSRMGRLVKDYTGKIGVAYDIEATLQDYYECRSRFFAEKIIINAQSVPELFKEMLMTFAKNVPIHKICQYDRFKRRAYDADYATACFRSPAEGEKYYRLCEERDESEYLYQQEALYYDRKKMISQAFESIEKARKLSHYNHFSIQSTYAIIYFHANISKDDENCKEALQDALDMLRECCDNDQRRWIHFHIYAEDVLEYYRKFDDETALTYLETALAYIEEGVNNSNIALTEKNKRRLRTLQLYIQNAIKKLVSKKENLKQ